MTETHSPPDSFSSSNVPAPTPKQIKKWRNYLADEQAEGAVYRDLASRKTGEEREILLALADAEKRHEQHWRDLLGPHIGKPLKGSKRTRMLGWLARRFGGVFVLALAQQAEGRTAYEADADAPAKMLADERIHGEVVRGLATRGRQRISGTFRAAIFGANDGLVSNLALILGIGASGASHGTVLLSGFAGLLAGALSMGAGEYVSVSSQRELLAAENPSPKASQAIGDLDVDQNELALVYRARGMSSNDAETHAKNMIANFTAHTKLAEDAEHDKHEAVGTAWGAAISSFFFFASGALIPILPYMFGLDGLQAVWVASALVGVALILTGTSVGVLSGSSPLRRAIRQLAIGFGAAAVTYVLGLLFGATIA
ncbi:VIT1/CCC1 transporter family protein [Timonella sp. A28]|uniref:VIT1/CCC1 transporter family protein n=1 Tax=Timonella sp. A28 TaxID=3442640 RepID=UPI003EB70079